MSRTAADTIGEATHMKTTQNKRCSGGFTLLEMLVAMTILSIMGAAIFTMFNQSTRTWQMADARNQQFSSARNALDMIGMELRQAIVAPKAGGQYGAQFYGLKNGDNPFGRADADTASGQIYFVAPTDTRDAGAEQDLCVIGYWVKDDPASNVPGKQLMRYCLSDNKGTDWSIFRPDSDNGTNQELGVNVKSLEFEFWVEGDTNWDTATDEWVSDSGGAPQEGNLPQAVRITLVVEDTTGSEQDKTFTSIVRLNAAR